MAQREDIPPGITTTAVTEPGLKVYSVQLSGYGREYRGTVQTLMYSGLLEHVQKKYGCVLTVRVGVRKTEVVIAVVIDEAVRVARNEPPVEKWPRFAMGALPDKSFRVLCIQRV